VQKLISELTRLYLAPGLVAPDLLERQLQGAPGAALRLVTDQGLTRAVVIAFRKTGSADDAQHWTLLCTVANALQGELGLPAPAVSISGADGFHLWLSLETPMPVALVRQFLALLHKTYFPDLVPDAEPPEVALPPCLHLGSGKWSAFINPGLGASFADESGLEMAPPLAGQIALLAGLQSATQAQLAHAMQVLEQTDGVSAPQPVPAALPQGLLLKDATLEDIVSFLHAKNIEPTFRHLLPVPPR
jgi:hypothetical protein